VLKLVFNEPGFEGNTYGQHRHARFYTIAWNRGETQQVTVDGMKYEFPGHTIMPFMSNQAYSFAVPEYITAWQFNREFYCIVNHDQEVGCAGFLFYHANGNLPVRPDETAARKIQLLLDVFRDEFENDDHVQEEMLRMLLVRLILTITRLAKVQYVPGQQYTDQKFELFRRFNLMVEQHFRDRHDVSFYAGQLHKSPKTLSNLFALYSGKSPIRVIHDRILMEAKRLLLYTNKSAKEISREIGFDDAAYFSRFFRKQTGQRLSEFRQSARSEIGKNGQSFGQDVHDPVA
jgi:AraC-like DNA-binding protein